MSRILPLAFAAAVLVAGGVEVMAQEAVPRVVQASRYNTSEPIRDLPIVEGNYRYLPYAIPNKFHDFDRQPAPDRPADFVDPVLDEGQAARGGGTVLQSFEGYDEDDNAAVAQVVVPPDANGDVGPNHYLQWVNLGAKIFDKSGTLLLGPVPGNFFFTGLGGRCETENDGDPIVLYDELADRWVVMQFQISIGDDLCVAVSTTPDPTGSYHQYEFDFPDFPDYPKLGVWRDAYYATTRVFAGGYQGQEAVAFERDAMLVGDPAQMVVFNIPGGSSIDGFIPVDADTNSPSGSPGLFIGGPRLDLLRIYEFGVNWSNPNASTFSLARTLTPASYDDSFGNVPQPSPGESLATLSFTLMHRAQYRDFGSYETMVLNHSVDAGSDRAGVRWYELRDTGSGWTIYQQGTFAPNDGQERWMGSIAMNSNGDIALGYSVSSSSQFPSLYFTGQTADQSGTGVMNVGETLIHAGTGAQFGSFSRWGDYSMMAVDPSDDTFWFTSEYYQTTSSFNFKTRIAQIALPGTGTCNQTLAATLDDSSPSPGQTVIFSVTVTNNDPGAASVDLWVDATGPVSRRLRLGSGTVPGNSSVMRDVPLRIPANAPAGSYALDLNVGDFGSDDICDTVPFTLNVSAPRLSAGGEAGEPFEVVEAVDLSETAPAAAAEQPAGARLVAASPNPFRLATTITFALPEATDVTLAVFDMLGRQVAVLQDGVVEAGQHTVALDASGLPSGAYVVRLTSADGASQAQRISLLR